MRILQVNAANFQPIPPNGWGAIEKIIWAYAVEMKKLGHTVDILHLGEVPDFSIYDVVHCHAYDLALDLFGRGVPYIYTFHDHNVYLQGKGSQLYRENLKAMKGAALAIVPAPYLIDYFAGVPVYLEHGVDVEIYKAEYRGFGLSRTGILCVGNNGLCGEVERITDRKGFIPAIRQAEAWGLPITIAGPSKVNKQFFKENPPPYSETTLLYDLSDEDLVRLYKTHEYLLHLTEIEAGHPPLTILEALASGLKVAATNCGDVPGIVTYSEDMVFPWQNRPVAQHQAIAETYAWPVVVAKLLKHYQESGSLRSKLRRLYAH